MSNYRYCIPIPSTLVPAGEYPITNIQTFVGTISVTFKVGPFEEISLPINRIQFMI